MGTKSGISLTPRINTNDEYIGPTPSPVEMWEVRLEKSTPPNDSAACYGTTTVVPPTPMAWPPNQLNQNTPS